MVGGMCSLLPYGTGVYHDAFMLKKKGFGSIPFFKYFL